MNTMRVRGVPAAGARPAPRSRARRRVETPSADRAAPSSRTSPLRGRVLAPAGRSPAAAAAATPDVPMSSSASRTGRPSAVVARPRAAAGTRSTSNGNSSAAGTSPCRASTITAAGRSARTASRSCARSAASARSTLLKRHHVGRAQLRAQQRVIRASRPVSSRRPRTAPFPAAPPARSRDPSGCGRYRRDRRSRWFRSR